MVCDQSAAQLERIVRNLKRQHGRLSKWIPVVCAFAWEKAIPEPAWECCWNAQDSASSEQEDPNKNKSAGSYRIVPDHSCGCAPLFHYGEVSLDGFSYGRFQNCYMFIKCVDSSGIRKVCELLTVVGLNDLGSVIEITDGPL